MTEEISVTSTRRSKSAPISIGGKLSGGLYSTTTGRPFNSPGMTGFGFFVFARRANKLITSTKMKITKRPRKTPKRKLLLDVDILDAGYVCCGGTYVFCIYPRGIQRTRVRPSSALRGCVAQ